MVEKLSYYMHCLERQVLVFFRCLFNADLYFTFSRIFCTNQMEILQGGVMNILTLQKTCINSKHWCELRHLVWVTWNGKNCSKTCHLTKVLEQNIGIVPIVFSDVAQFNWMKMDRINHRYYRFHIKENRPPKHPFDLFIFHKCYRNERKFSCFTILKLQKPRL